MEHFREKVGPDAVELAGIFSSKDTSFFDKFKHNGEHVEGNLGDDNEEQTEDDLEFLEHSISKSRFFCERVPGGRELFVVISIFAAEVPVNG